VQQPPVGLGILIIEGSQSCSDAPQSVGLLWTSDQPVAQTSTCQHTTHTTERYPCPLVNSNPQFQQAGGAADPSFSLRGNWQRYIVLFSWNMPHSRGYNYKRKNGMHIFINIHHRQIYSTRIYKLWQPVTINYYNFNICRYNYNRSLKFLCYPETELNCTCLKSVCVRPFTIVHVCAFVAAKPPCNYIRSQFGSNLFNCDVMCNVSETALF
jgi:hypothetical protein